jgi:hypothetical protein
VTKNRLYGEVKASVDSLLVHILTFAFKELESLLKNYHFSAQFGAPQLNADLQFLKENLPAATKNDT